MIGWFLIHTLVSLIQAIIASKRLESLLVSTLNFKSLWPWGGDPLGIPLSLVSAEGDNKLVKGLSAISTIVVEEVKSYEPEILNSWFSCDVTVAMLVYRTIAKKVFWDLDSFIEQNLCDVLPLFYTSTWPSHHVSVPPKNNQFTLVEKTH